MKIVLLSTIDAPLLGYYLRAAEQQGAVISAVLLDSKPVTEKDQRIHEERTGGRLPALPLHSFERAAIPYYFVENHASDWTAQLLKTLGADLAVNAGTPRILKKATLEAARHGVLNCHPGILPGYRGASCVEWAVYNNEPVGNTVHLMTEGIDEGPVFRSEEVALLKSDDYQALRTKVYISGIELLMRCIRDLQSGHLKISDAQAQGPGAYYKPIDAEKMQVVIERLSRGEFSRQF